MRITELLAHTDNLDEASLRDIARAGVLGAGLIGAGLGANNMLSKAPAAPTAISQPAQAVNAAPTADSVIQAKNQAEPQKTQNNPNFPAELKGLDSKDANTRVHTFKQVVLPLIDAENAEIKKQRQALVQLSKAKSLTKEQAAWIEGMKAYYKADNLRDLVAKVDIVPRSMALAQAAVESGWGQQPLAQQANVFYGQKTFDPEAPSATGQYGEKYRAFDSPQDSVRAYMRNLNTHPAYEPFRSARAELRQKNRPLQGAQLVKSLGSYSTKGGYGQQLHSIIQARGLNKLDTN
jgi:Bax protein